MSTSPAPLRHRAPSSSPAGVHRTTSNTTASSSFTSLRDKVVRALSPNRDSAIGDVDGAAARGGPGRRPSFGGE
ncbi:hypothetical protein IAT38_002016 [Cryptococcus sp. DSM 104549]